MHKIFGVEVGEKCFYECNSVLVTEIPVFVIALLVESVVIPDSAVDMRAYCRGLRQLMLSWGRWSCVSRDKS